MEKCTPVFYDSLILYGLTLAFSMKSDGRNRGLKAVDVIHGLERGYGECMSRKRRRHSHWIHLDVQRDQTRANILDLHQRGNEIVLFSCSFLSFHHSHILNRHLKVRFICFPSQTAWNIFQLS